MRNLNALEWAAIIATVVGAINWGLVGLFNFDVVAALFGAMGGFTRVVYAIVGVAGIVLAFTAPMLHRTTHESRGNEPAFR